MCRPLLSKITSAWAIFHLYHIQLQKMAFYYTSAEHESQVPLHCLYIFSYVRLSGLQDDIDKSGMHGMLSASSVCMRGHTNRTYFVIKLFCVSRSMCFVLSSEVTPLCSKWYVKQETHQRWQSRSSSPGRICGLRRQWTTGPSAGSPCSPPSPSHCQPRHWVLFQCWESRETDQIPAITNQHNPNMHIQYTTRNTTLTSPH